MIDHFFDFISRNQEALYISLVFLAYFYSCAICITLPEAYKRDGENSKGYVLLVYNFLWAVALTPVINTILAILLIIAFVIATVLDRMTSPPLKRRFLQRI